MAIVRVRPGDKRPPAFGPIYFASRRGYLYASAKPRKKARIKNTRQLEQMAWFKEAAHAIRYMDAEQLHVAKKLTKPFNIMWRDLLMQHLAGNFGALLLENGRLIHSLSEQQDVSNSLDAIGQGHGDILYRASGGWRALLPGAAGRVLATQGVGADPAWVPGGGGSTMLMTNRFTFGAQTNAPHACKGHYINVSRTMELKEFVCHVKEIVGVKYKIVVADTDGSKITALLAESPEYTGVFNTIIVQGHSLPAVLTVTAGQKIVIFLVRVSTPPNTSNLIYFNNQGWLLLPAASGSANAWLDSNDPAVDDVFTIDASFVTYGLFFSYGVI